MTTQVCGGEIFLFRLPKCGVAGLVPREMASFSLLITEGMGSHTDKTTRRYWVPPGLFGGTFSTGRIRVGLLTIALPQLFL